MFKYHLFQLLRFVVRLIPPRAAYVIAAVLAEGFYFFSRRSKPNFNANIRHVLKYSGQEVSSRKSRRKIRMIGRKNFRNFAYYLVDFFRFSRFDQRQLDRFVEVEGLRHINRILRRGKGAVGVTAHLGNWELGGIVFSLLGYPVNAIALSHQNTKLNRLFVHQRALAGVKVIPVGKAALRSLRALKENGVVVILGDRDVTERGVKATFFGVPTFLPRGPAVLAARSGAGIFFGYVIRESTHKYQTVFRPEIERDYSASLEEQEERILKGLVKEMEDCIIAHLDQWYMYFRLWPDER